MAVTYTPTQYATWTRVNASGGGRFPAAGFADGYFITLKPGLQVIELWQVDAPTTLLDDFDTGAVTVWRGFTRNNVGDVYAARATSTAGVRTLTRITQSAGTLTVTDIGDWTAATGATGPLYLSADDSEVIYQQSSPRRTMGLSTVDASENYDIDWTGSGHTCWVVATPAPDRFIAYCSDHTDYELWEGSTQTLLDNINDDNGRGTDVYPCSASLNKVVWVSRSGTETHSIGVLNTSADTLAWDWQGTLSTPGWDVLDAIAECRGTIASFAPEADPTFPYPAISLYMADVLSGRVGTSAASTTIGQGATFTRTVGAMWISDSICMLGPENTDTDTWSAWEAVPSSGPTFLRQRQSPVRSPSRVSWKWY